MFAGTALSVRLFVYAGLSLFIISGPYLYMVVCVLYAYNLTMGYQKNIGNGQLVSNMIRTSGVLQLVSLQKPHGTSIITCLKRRRVKPNPCYINEILMSKNVSKTAQNMFWNLIISLEGFKVSFKEVDESDHTCHTTTFFKSV